MTATEIEAEHAPQKPKRRITHIVCCHSQPGTPERTLCGATTNGFVDAVRPSGVYQPDDCVMCVEEDQLDHGRCPRGGRCDRHE